MNKHGFSIVILFCIFAMFWVISGCSSSTNAPSSSSSTSSFSQSDLEGTWNVQFFAVTSAGASGWDYVTANIDSSGNLTAFSNCNDSSSNTTCPTANTITWTIASNGVITEGGTGGNTSAHLTMASDKAFIARTSTNGSNTYELGIAMKKASSYSSSSLYSTSFVFHTLSTNGSNSQWTYGAGNVDSTGTTTITSETISSGGTSSGSLGTVSVNSSTGGVTFTLDTNFYGFLSSDGKTIVGTETSGGYTGMVIIQITGQTYTAGTVPDGTWTGHMFAIGSSPAPFWAHYTSTASSGTISFSNVVSSSSSVTSLTSVSGAAIDSSGAITFSGSDYIYNGQESYDGDFVVGVETMHSTTTPIYLMAVDVK